MPSVTIIGMGRVGGALEIAFRDSPFRVVSLLGRSDPFDGVKSDIIIIATPDSEIELAAAGLAGEINRGSVVLHTSGALSSTELSVLSNSGYSIGSMHPLVSISTPEIGAKRFAGAYFCIEGDQMAVASANEIVAFLGGHSFEIPSSNKPLYHAAAVTACGHVTALLDLAFSMMQRSGVDGNKSKEILRPLIKSTLDNIYEQGTTAALTGTFARADAIGLLRQLNSFEGRLTNDEVEIYLDLARRSIEIAGSAPNKTIQIAEVKNLISMAKSKLR